MGKGINGGLIQNSYVYGKIKSDISNIGGISGESSGNIKNNFSFVDIESENNNIGGIIGNNISENLNTIEKNLSIGNLYTKSSTEKINSIIGSTSRPTNNYAYKGQRINGKEEKKGTKIISKEELLVENTYKNYLEMENLDYTLLKHKNFPQLYNSYTNEILANQTNISIPEDNEIEIKNIFTNKINQETVNIRLELKNKQGRNITNVIIKDMESKITQNVILNEITYIDLEAKPIRYYDKYKISEIKYVDVDTEKTEEQDVEVNVQFYKEIYKYEDWQNIEADIPQNYKIMQDIDFKGKVNVKDNIKISRLDGNDCTLKNIELKYNKNNNTIISSVQNEIKNVNFNNINIEAVNVLENVGIILKNYGDLNNVNFKDVTINAPKANYVGIILKNEGSNIDRINLNNINVIGKYFTGGLIGKTNNGYFKNITADKINVLGDKYTGGIFGYVKSNQNGEIKNITIKNSKINSNNDYVGGILGYENGEKEINMDISYINISYSTISGNNNVGGILGYAYTCKHSVINNVEVIGQNTIAGFAGQIVFASDIILEDSNIIGTGNYIGGLVGETRAVGEITNCYIKRININSTGDFVGGILGRNNRIVQKVFIEDSIIKGNDNVGTIVGKTEYDMKNIYAHNCRIMGNNNVGGISGMLSRGYISLTYNNSEIIGDSNIGGIIGYLANKITTDTTNTILINRNYAITQIQANSNIGGFIGKVDKELLKPYNNFKQNYFETYVVSQNEEYTSIGIGNRKIENSNLGMTYVYQYSKINNKIINADREYLDKNTFLNENDLKDEDTYLSKLYWSKNDWNFNSLKDEKYPLLSIFKEEQEGITIPTDPVIDETSEGSDNNGLLFSNEGLSESLQYTFYYEEKTIKTYNTFSEIISEDGNKAIRNNVRLYVKNGRLYALPVELNLNNSIIKLVESNFIIDSYNGKEYETVLGSDGKIYDLKESLKYPENFINKDITSIGNNLSKSYIDNVENISNEESIGEISGNNKHEIEVTYKNGDRVRFNYQTGEIKSSIEGKSNNTSLFNYVKEKISELGNLNSGELQEIANKYEESKVLQSKLEKMPVEEALKEPSNNTNKIENITNGENDKANNSLKETRYISIYNAEKDDYQIYQEEELLDTSKQEVISENDKIEANNLKEYYASEGESKNTNMGIVWITLSIVGVIIILFAIKKRD